MTDKPYLDPPRQTLDDLDPESATTDQFIAMVRSHREGEEYPTADVLLGNLPKVLRALCDHVLTGRGRLRKRKKSYAKPVAAAVAA